MVSVNTSSAAISAVSTLRSIDQRFISSSKRIETGYRVADSGDDASIFSVAQGVRAEVKTAASIQSSLSQGQNTAQVAMAGLKQIYDLTNDIRANIILLADGATAESARANIKADTQALLRQIDSVRSTSVYNGFAQLSADAEERSFIADSAGNTITVGIFDGQADLDALNTAVDNIDTSASALVALDAAAVFQQTVNLATADLAATAKGIAEKSHFVDSLTDALQKSLGALVDTDIADALAIRESAIVQRGLSIASLDFINASNRRVVNILR